jgi:hypothetical protein
MIKLKCKRKFRGDNLDLQFEGKRCLGSFNIDHWRKTGLEKGLEKEKEEKEGTKREGNYAVSIYRQPIFRCAAPEFLTNAVESEII